LRAERDSWTKISTSAARTNRPLFGAASARFIVSRAWARHQKVPRTAATPITSSTMTIRIVRTIAATTPRLCDPATTLACS
jgi:hypothetical protein